jgi:hypothetical protein
VNSYLSPVFAATISITNSGNGNSSGNTVTYSSATVTNLSQSNSADIENTVTQQADTGSNTASDNQGSVDIQTGDISTDTQITNEAGFNSSTIDHCCSGEVQLVNEGNGQNSTNNIDISIVDVVNPGQDEMANQENIINITNDSYKDLNTGNNTARDTQGNVKIKSGDIAESSEFNNRAGSNTADYSNGGISSLSADNSKNGRDSVNNITGEFVFESNTRQLNIVDINNNEQKDLNTGGNDCLDTSGDCEIETGDIVSKTDVENTTGSNDSDSSDDCCEHDGDNPVDPTVTPSPTPTPATDDPIGGPMEDTNDDSQDPNGTGDINDDSDEQDTTGPENKEDSIIDKIKDAVDSLVPEGGVVLAAGELPNTGLGYRPDVSWSTALISLGGLVIALQLRKLAQKLEKRFTS